MFKYAVLCVAIFAVALTACSSRVNTEEDPRKVVIKMFGAMEEDDRESLAHYLDFASIMQGGGDDYALSGDSARTFHSPDQILDDMTDVGLTKTRWFSMQRVVGSSTQEGDMALVEVSFIDQNTNTQYFNRFGLKKINGVWKIYSFSVKE